MHKVAVGRENNRNTGWTNIFKPGPFFGNIGPSICIACPQCVRSYPTITYHYSDAL